MSKFRKRPVEIEARQWDGSPESSREIVAWGSPHISWWFNRNLMAIATLEGQMSVSIGDWIIRDFQEEFYGCKPDVFEATYEAAVLVSER